MIITMKQGALALVPMLGLGGVTLKNDFLFSTETPLECIATSDRRENIDYVNICNYPVRAVICEDYNYKRGWLGGISAGTRACFRINFEAAAIYSVPKVNSNLTKTTITQCDAGHVPRWNAGGYECVLDDI